MRIVDPSKFFPVTRFSVTSLLVTSLLCLVTPSSFCIDITDAQGIHKYFLDRFSVHSFNTMQGAQPLIIHSLYRCIYVVGLKGSEFRFLPIHDRQTFKLFRQYIISGIVLEDYVINGNKVITLRSFSMSWSDIEASQ